jgi:hypothetical protein
MRIENIKTFKNLATAEQKKTLVNTLVGGALLAFNWLFFYLCHE